jgi:hypothetical protein
VLDEDFVGPVVDTDDAKSSYDDESHFTDTTSLRSSIMRYREEHGRTYHSYGKRPRDGLWYPVINPQQDQLSTGVQMILRHRISRTLGTMRRKRIWEIVTN